MAVPLFDTNTPRRAAARADRRGDRRRRRVAALHPRARRSRAFEAEFAALCGTRHAVGVANGTDALTIALRAMGVGPGDDVVVPVVHVLRDRRGGPADGRAAGLLRRRPRHVLRHRRDRRRRADAGHEGGRRRAPVRQPRAGGRDRGARRAGARGRRAGRGHAQRRRAPRRARAARRRSASFPPRTSAASATAARSRPTTTRSPRPPGCCASTARTTRSPTSTSATTRASTSCRRRSCASSCRRSTTGPTGAAPPRATTRTAGLGELVSLPGGVGRLRAGLASVRRAHRPRRRARRRPRRARDRLQGLLPRCRSTASRRCSQIAAGVELPVTDDLARTHLAIPMSPVLSAEQAAEVTAAVRAVLA